MRIRWTAAAATSVLTSKTAIPTTGSPLFASRTELSVKESPNRGRLGRVDGTRELLFLPLPYIAVNRVNERTGNRDAAHLPRPSRSALMPGVDWQPHWNLLKASRLERAAIVRRSKRKLQRGRKGGQRSLRTCHP